MSNSIYPCGAFRLLPGLWGLVLAALIVSAFSACGAPQPPQPPRATLFNSSQSGVIYALNAQNGAVRWQYHTVDTVFGAGLARPVLLNGTIYAATSSGGLVVYALDAQNGSARWKVNLSNTPMPPEQPVTVNNVLYVVAARFAPDTATLVYALRVQDGSVLWHYQAAGYPSAKNFTVADGAVYLPLDNASLLALDAATGTVRWQARLPGKGTSTPTVADGLVIISANTGSVQALRTDTGALAWSYTIKTLDWASSPATTRDLTYASGADGSIVALRTKDGAPRWHVRPAQTASMLVMAQGTLYAMPVGGPVSLYALRASDGSTRWQYQTYEHPCLQGSSVTVVDQVVYCIGADYSVVLLDASSGQSMRHYFLATNLLSSYPVVVGPGK